VDPVFTLAAACALALVLALGAVEKLLGFGRFQGAVGEYRILPSAAVPVFAALVVALELGASVLLVVPGYSRSGVVAAWLLLALVSSGLGINLARGRTDLDCGCGGAGQRISWSLIWRNAGLALIGLFALATTDARALGGADIAVIAAAAVVWTALYRAADQLLASANLMRRAHA
jgi:hypothetical protein